MERAEADSPDRCQSVNSHGQCNLKALEGSKFCAAHGGGSAEKEEKKKALRNYRLTSWRSRVNELGDSPQIKSVRDEIGILRLLMEERLNSCKSTTDLIMHSQAISELVTKIEHVVTSCHRLESQMGQMLDKQAIIKFAGKVVETITTIINNLVNDQTIDEQIAETINSQIADALIENMSDLDPTGNGNP